VLFFVTVSAHCVANISHFRDGAGPPWSLRHRHTTQDYCSWMTIVVWIRCLDDINGYFYWRTLRIGWARSSFIGSEHLMRSGHGVLCLLLDLKDIQRIHFARQESTEWNNLVNLTMICQALCVTCKSCSVSYRFYYL